MCRFTTADRGRSCGIYVEGEKIMEYTIPGRFTPSENGFFNIEVPIKNELLKDKKGKAKAELTFQLKAEKGSLCPGLYYVRLLKSVE